MDPRKAGTLIDEQEIREIMEHQSQINKKIDSPMAQKSDREVSDLPGPSFSVFSDAKSTVTGPVTAKVVIQEFLVPSDSSSETFFTCESAGSMNSHGDGDREEPKARIDTRLRNVLSCLVEAQRQNTALACATRMFWIEMGTQAIVGTFSGLTMLMKSTNIVQFFNQNERAVAGMFVLSLLYLGLGCFIVCGTKQSGALHMVQNVWQYSCVILISIARVVAYYALSFWYASTLWYQVLACILAVLTTMPELWIIIQIRKIAVLRQDTGFTVHYGKD